MNQEISNQLNELATKKVSRKKFMGFGLAVAGTTFLSGFFKSRQAAPANLSNAKEQRLTEIYKNITNIKK